jgi:hypothetical protein
LCKATLIRVERFSSPLVIRLRYRRVLSELCAFMYQASFRRAAAPFCADIAWSVKLQPAECATQTALSRAAATSFVELLLRWASSALRARLLLPLRWRPCHWRVWRVRHRALEGVSCYSLSSWRTPSRSVDRLLPGCEGLSAPWISFVVNRRPCPGRAAVCFHNELAERGDPLLLSPQHHLVRWSGASLGGKAFLATQTASF